MILFSLNGTNYTNNILVPSYKVNRKDVYGDWEDANYRKHKHVVRTRISGSFTLYFDDEQSYFKFLDDYKNSKGAEGYSLVSLYVENEHTVVDQVKAFIDFEPATTLPYFGIKPHDGFEVTIEEA